MVLVRVTAVLFRVRVVAMRLVGLSLPVMTAMAKLSKHRLRLSMVTGARCPDGDITLASLCCNFTTKLLQVP